MNSRNAIAVPGIREELARNFIREGIWGTDPGCAVSPMKQLKSLRQFHPSLMCT